MMMKFRYPYILLATVMLALAATGFIFYKGSNIYKKDIPLSHEQELKVTINAGYGDIYLSRGSGAELLHANIDAELKHDLDDYIEYSSRDNIGYLDISTSDENEKSNNDHNHSIHFNGFGTNTWDMHFTDAIPISYDVELGVGKADFDFSGLLIKDLNLSTGASSVDMRFDKHNRSVIEDMNIESGVSKFHAEGLCNANFSHMKFQGGVGSYELDFGGKLDKEADVDIEVGLGSLTVIIPEHIGAKIEYEKTIIAHISLADDFSEQEQNTYYSANYYDAPGKLNMHIEAGLGSVKIRRQP